MNRIIINTIKSLVIAAFITFSGNGFKFEINKFLNLEFFIFAILIYVVIWYFDRRTNKHSEKNSD